MTEVKVYISIVQGFESEDPDKAEALAYDYIERIKTNCAYEAFEASVEVV